MASPHPKKTFDPTFEVGESLSLAQRAEMRDVLQRAMQESRYGRLPMRSPKEAAQMQKHPGMHYHFKPELFLQMEGTTTFTTPTQEVVVKAGELCLIPAGVPHKEHVEAGRSGAFRNLVAGFYSRTLSLHFAFEIEPGKPEIEAIEFFDVPDLEVFTMLANQVVAVFHASHTAREPILHGLQSALLGMLLNLVDVGSDQLNRDIDKVFQAKWLVRENIGNSKLNVKNMAEKLHCSADYLSHLFHHETGEKLVHYIQRIRIEGARLALESTQLTVSEIAFSSGFADPAYFTRVFKRFTGLAPNAYRQRKETERKLREQAPKTIYYDHDDYSPGVPAKKAKAKRAKKKV